MAVQQVALNKCQQRTAKTVTFCAGAQKPPVLSAAVAGVLFQGKDMSVGYSLVNATRKEQISFSHLPVSTRNEIDSNPVSAFLVNWYLAQNRSDQIEFVSDTYDDWPFDQGDRSELSIFKDVTDKALSELIDRGLIIDHGKEWEDEDEPETVYIRNLSLKETEQGI